MKIVKNLVIAATAFGLALPVMAQTAATPAHANKAQTTHVKSAHKQAKPVHKQAKHHKAKTAKHNKTKTAKHKNTSHAKKAQAPKAK